MVDLMSRDIEYKLIELLEPMVEDNGAELLDVLYLQEHGRWVLRLYVDTPGGITIGEVTDITREAGPILDVEDIIPHSYSLEVSSPGPDRPLRKPEHFTLATGHMAKIRLKEPMDGRKNFKAVIDGFEDGTLLVTDTAGEGFKLDFDNIDRANLEDEFNV